MRELFFTNPSMLWGLAAASLPVVIHLINRHRARRHAFAAIDFLFRVQRRSARRILLKQILLLLIRTLLICALVLAAAGPLLRPPVHTTASGPVTTCLILDRSFSMRMGTDDGDRYTQAKDRAREVVRGLGPGDSACLVAAGNKTEALVEPCTNSAGSLLDAIDGQAAEWGTSDLSEALEISASLLAKAATPNRRIVLLSDGAAHAFSGAPAWPDARPPAIVLHDLGREHPASNHALIDLEQSRSGPYLELTARLRQTGVEGAEDLPIQVTLGDQTAARGFVSLPLASPVAKLFTIRAPSGQTSLGAIETAKDGLPDDDRYPFLATGHHQIEVLLINGDMRPVLHRDELFYLEHALSPSGPGASGIRFKSVTPDRFHEGMLQSAQVVFLANVSELKPASLSALQEFVTTGGGLFVSLGDRVDVNHSNQQFQDLLPADLRDVVSLRTPDQDEGSRAGMAFGEIDDSHPALQIFKEQGRRALAAVRTHKAVVLETSQTGRQNRVLIRYTNGAPALVEGRYGSGRVMLLTTSLDRDWTNWPARASFLPFLQHAVAFLAGSLDALPPLSVLVGQALQIPLLPEADGIRILTPEGESIDLRAGDLVEGRAEFDRTSMPGWYSVEQLAGSRVLPGRTTPGFFVRISPAESDLTPMDTDRLQTLIGHGAQLTLAGQGDGNTRPMAWLLLLLALGLVLCEGFLIRR